MTDPKQNQHWEALARELGAKIPACGTEESACASETETPPDEEKLPSAEERKSSFGLPKKAASPDSPPTSNSPRRRVPRPSPPSPKNHWASVAGDLGLSVAVQPVDDEHRESPASLTVAELASSDIRPSDISDANSVVPTTPERPSEDSMNSSLSSEPIADDSIFSEGSFIDEIPDRETLQAEADDDRPEGNQQPAAETVGRKPRRRRGRRGRRRRGTGSQAAVTKSDVKETEAAFGETVDNDDGKSPAVTDDPLRECADNQSLPRESSQRPYQRRDDDAEQSAEFLETEEPVAASSPDSETQDDRGESKRGSRRFPTWNEAIGIIVSANMESRQKSGSTGGSRGRRRRSGGRRK